MHKLAWFLLPLIALLGACDFHDAQYQLGIVNSTANTAMVTVTDSSSVLTIEPRTSRTFQIKDQAQKGEGSIREFHIKLGDAGHVVKGYVRYYHTVVLSVTGDDNVVAADIGHLYEAPGTSVADKGKISVLQVYRHLPVFVTGVDDKTGQDTWKVAISVGEAAPTSVTQKEYGKFPTIIRLVAVPDDVVDNPPALDHYLHEQ